MSSKTLVQDIVRKLESVETRCLQHESMINQLRAKTLEFTETKEYREIREKINRISMKVNEIEFYTQFLKQDND